MEAGKKMLDALAENVAKSPGWLPLLILCYFGFMLVPDETTIFGVSLKSHAELIVLGITLLLYVLGDLLDKWLFNWMTEQRLEKARSNIKKILKLTDGTYRVSTALATASKELMWRWIQFENESAKFLRSLVFPSAVAVIVLLIRAQVVLAGVAFAGMFVFFLLYIRLKASHVKGLYRLSERLVEKKYPENDCNEDCNDDCESHSKEHLKYAVWDLSDRVRLFFWDGELVGSGKRPVSARDKALVNSPRS